MLQLAAAFDDRGVQLLAQNRRRIESIRPRGERPTAERPIDRRAGREGERESERAALKRWTSETYDRSSGEGAETRHLSHLRGSHVGRERPKAKGREEIRKGRHQYDVPT